MCSKLELESFLDFATRIVFRLWPLPRLGSTVRCRANRQREAPVNYGAAQGKPHLQTRSFIPLTAKQ